MIEVEVFGCHVATAGNTCDTVEDGGFVVHALVDAAELQQRVFELLPGAHAHHELRVVDADLHVRMCGQQQQRSIFRVDDEVVDEHSNRHTAFCGGQQLFGGEDADVVGAPDEVLHIDRARCVHRQPRAADERFFAFLQDVHTGLRLHASGAVVTDGFEPFVDRRRCKHARGTQHQEKSAESQVLHRCNRRRSPLLRRQNFCQ